MKSKLFLYVLTIFLFSAANSQAVIQGPRSIDSISSKTATRSKYGVDEPEVFEAAGADIGKMRNNTNTAPAYTYVNEDQSLINTPGNLKCISGNDDMLYCVDEKDKPFTGRKTVQFNENRFKSIENFKNGYRDGLCTYFDKFGQRHERAYYKQGIKNGMYKLYHSDNHIKVIATYKDGLLDSTSDIYLSDGTLWGRMRYKRGYLEKGFCQKNGKKENLSYEAIKAHPFNTLNSCGLPL